MPVAPLAGAWIEIPILCTFQTQNMVAPLAGAWIEMFQAPNYLQNQQGRSPRGSVD